MSTAGVWFLAMIGLAVASLCICGWIFAHWATRQQMQPSLAELDAEFDGLFRAVEALTSYPTMRSPPKPHIELDVYCMPRKCRFKRGRKA